MILRANKFFTFIIFRDFLRGIVLKIMSKSTCVWSAVIETYSAQMPLTMVENKVFQETL